MLTKCVCSRLNLATFLRVQKINKGRSVNCLIFGSNQYSNKSSFLRPWSSLGNISRIPANADGTVFIKHSFSTQRSEIDGGLTPNNFDQISDDTIDSLAEYFDEILENCPHIKDYDVSYGDGVLTVKFGEPYGTYVINRQTPNQQIWLSSPTSGPKRYDFDHGQWIYRHDGITLHQLLDREIGNIVNTDVHFSNCAYSGTQNGSHEPKKK